MTETTAAAAERAARPALRRQARGGAAAIVQATEFRLFCRGLHQPLDAAAAATLREAIGPDLAWDDIVAGAARHRVAPLLLRNLQACGPARVPPGALAELRRQALAAAQRSLAQTAEVGRLARRFREAGLRVLAVKGVALSTQLYGDPGRRDARDIDLLVDPDDFARAEAALVAAGYCAAGDALSPRQRATYLRRIKEAEYVDAGTGLRVELHHRLSDNPGLIPGEFAVLWREREEVILAGEPVATLARRHLGLYLALHGAGHGWERLGWLVDFTAAMQAPDAVVATLAAADRAGVAAPVRQAVQLAHDWLGLPLTEAILAGLRRERPVARLDRILAHFYAGPAWHAMPARHSLAGLLRYSLWLRLYAYSLKTDWRYRRDQALRELVAPGDWAALPLPDRLFWLFPLIRPFGWLLRRWPSRRATR